MAVPREAGGGEGREGEREREGGVLKWCMMEARIIRKP